MKNIINITVEAFAVFLIVALLAHCVIDHLCADQESVHQPRIFK